MVELRSFQELAALICEKTYHLNFLNFTIVNQILNTE